MDFRLGGRLPALDPAPDSPVDIYRDLFKQTLPGFFKTQALERIEIELKATRQHAGVFSVLGL